MKENWRKPTDNSWPGSCGCPQSPPDSTTGWGDPCPVAHLTIREMSIAHSTSLTQTLPSSGEELHCELFLLNLSQICFSFMCVYALG